MKKILTILMMFALTLGVNAKNTVKRDFSSVINESGIEKNAISVSIRDLNSGKPV